MKHVLAIPFLALAVAACQATSASVSTVPLQHVGESDQLTPDPFAPGGSPIAGAHDLVAAPAPGATRTVDGPLRPIEGASSGRVWLLEMYQNALAQKDELARRANDLSHERDAAVQHASELEKTNAELTARNASLATELRDLQQKSIELARRLAESEIARLESEKAALERRSQAARTGKP